MSRAVKSTISSLVFSMFGVIIVFCVPSSAFAQGIPGIGTPISMVIEPANPKPLETVSISLQSFSVNIDQASITWLSGGKVIQKGTGLKAITVQAGGLGSSKTIEAIVSTKEAGELSASVAIRPADLTLVWQAASYVPPFYKGKALLPFGGSYKVVAMPEILDKSGKRIDPRTLIYAWKKNGANQSSVSGYGKSFFVSSQTSFVRQGDEIAVEVTHPTDGFTVSGSIEVAPIAPEIHLYEDSPLYGIVSEKELGDRITLANEEISIAAEPFFFSVIDKQSSLLDYTWTLNSASAPDFQNRSTIILRRTDKAAGSSEIGLTIGNSARLLQGANRSLLIRYE